MTFKTHISLNEYRRLIYLLTYRKGWTIYVSIIGVIMFVSALANYAGISEVQTEPLFGLVFGAFVIFVLPISIYFTAQKNYASNKRISEGIEYTFTADKMYVSGKSFNSELGLAEVYRIEELKNWILIYQSKQTANFISKAELSDQQLSELRYILSGLVGVKVKLKQ